MKIILQSAICIGLIIGGTWIAFGYRAAAVMMMSIGILYSLGLLAWWSSEDEERKRRRNGR